MRRLIVSSLAAGLLSMAGIGAAAATGPPAIGFYVDGELYRTVGTPTDLSGTGAPPHTYDVIYALGPGLMNVAESKPGDPDYNGGRWRVLPVTWIGAPVQLTSAEHVLAAAVAGDVVISSTPVNSFVCPVIQDPGS